ncbi:hypothetical protein SODALDRAFT_142666 [Sodiomyces alkalinus F11]|uniref:Uncharacterized protein n=1 Tax=Sodiomyces alkalinus (strain CBS 110278 / VKM F-3762 / F11) TaxID=1314773 RepID=A0A3N2PZN6_SODAK|nr:hypothetical protein SODALDRAFT_142666 [Sodiomyces alkalinus F11]ROT39967.1 hypothetical protein SODALDRAFT_142666 [Sodiomyces alkalinus F11]
MARDQSPKPKCHSSTPRPTIPLVTPPPPPPPLPPPPPFLRHHHHRLFPRKYRPAANLPSRRPLIKHAAPLPFEHILPQQSSKSPRSLPHPELNPTHLQNNNNHDDNNNNNHDHLFNKKSNENNNSINHQDTSTHFLPYPLLGQRRRLPAPSNLALTMS